MERKILKEDSMGKIFVVGFGPGNKENMTIDALNAIEASDIIIGYTVYIELMKKMYPLKEYQSTPMRSEIERCRLCFEKAKEGKVVSLICSGDAGIYGMASPVLSLADEYDLHDITIIPGVTAAVSGGAVLGSPLTSDFCVVSLSNALTPWEVIVKRLKAAASGGFVTVLYNPRSKTRPGLLNEAVDIFINEGVSKDTPSGYVKNIGRDKQEYKILTLEELKTADIDMFTTVFIGNEETEVINDRLVTRRGYKI